jgi:hypothetical protein
MFLVELLLLTQPYLLGKGIDGLIVGEYFWMGLLGLTYIVTDFFIYKRMVFDTKIYSKIYNNLVFKLLDKPDLDESTKMARTDMSHDIVGVLEGHIHYYITTLITIVGSLIFIYTTNYLVGIMVTISFIFILIAVLLFYKKIRQVINVRYNHYENKLKSLQQSKEVSNTFFIRRRRLLILESNLQGKNWVSVSFIRHVFLFICIILLVVTTKDVSTGTIVTIYSYVNNFLVSLMSIPVTMEMYSRITDILKRVD